MVFTVVVLPSALKLRILLEVGVVGVFGVVGGFFSGARFSKARNGAIASPGDSWLAAAVEPTTYREGIGGTGGGASPVGLIMAGDCGDFGLVELCGMPRLVRLVKELLLASERTDAFAFSSLGHDVSC